MNEVNEERRIQAHYNGLGRELRGIKRARDRADIRARELAWQRLSHGWFHISGNGIRAMSLREFLRGCDVRARRG